MGFGSKGARPLPESTPTGVEDEQLSTSQEAVPVPQMAGTRKISLKWISRVYNQHARKAPAERPAKK